MILQLTGSRILHTAYSNNNLGDPEGFSLISQAGATYKGTYIDESTTESTDPKDYYWEELFNPDIDDTDDAGNYGTLTNEAELAALQSQITALQTRSQEMAEALTDNQNNTSSAAVAAGQAQAIAEATGQHFWDNDNGAHVTEVTKEEFNDPDSPNYQSGANTIWNSLGMLFRKGINNLLALIVAQDQTEDSGMIVYDGGGNNSVNIIASFLGRALKYFYQGVEIFSVETAANNQEISEQEKFNSFQSDGIGTQTRTKVLNYTVLEITEIQVFYNWSIQITGLPSGTATATLTEAEPSYTMIYNDMPYGTISFTRSGKSITLSLYTETADAAVTVTGAVFYYSTGSAGASRIFLGAYPNKAENVAFAIGNGSSEENSNAFSVDWNGKTDGADYFHVGDTYSETYTHVRPVAGYVSSSTAVMYFEIPLPKKLDYVYTAEVTALTGNLRGIRGYVDGKSGTSDLAAAYSIAASPDFTNGLYVSLTKSSALTNTTNNTPVILGIKSITVRFTKGGKKYLL